MGVTASHSHSARRAFAEPRTLDDYAKAKLWEWADGVPAGAGETQSMVVVAPYTYQDLLALVQEIWDLRQNPEDYSPYDCIVIVDIPTVHFDFALLRPKEVLFYILRELKHAKSNLQEQGTEGQVENKYLDPWEVYRRRLQIYREKKRAIALLRIKENIKEMKSYEKIDKIKSDIQGRLENKGDGLPKGDKLQGDFDQLDLDVQLQLLLQAASQQDQKGRTKTCKDHRYGTRSTSGGEEKSRWRRDREEK
uniref:Uncharacterized protein n=1 Tax=Triticum aestivum TaxID=4565 RepID=A0A3B6H1E5_WHEAT